MNHPKKYNGVVVPMVTPMNSDYSIDESAVEKITGLFLKAGVSPFIIGTTGEAPSLSSDQKSNLVKAVVKAVNRKTLVYAGISSTCISDSIRDGKLFEELGADVLVATLPAYYPMKPEQMFRYFTELADQVNLPVVIYNMPATVKISIPLDIIDRLSKHPNIVGLKDSERDEERMMNAIELWKERRDFAYLIGWAAMSAKAMLNGADGIVPSTGNFAPEFYKRLVEAALDLDECTAYELQEETNDLSLLYQKDRILSESIPALKEIMCYMDLCNPTVMPPMYEISEQERVSLVGDLKNKLSTVNMMP